MADNIKIAEQLKKLQNEIAASVDAQNRALRTQTEILREVVKLYQDTNPKDSTDRLIDLNNSLMAAAESAKKMGDSSQNTTERMSSGISKIIDKQGDLNTATLKTSKTLKKFGGALGFFDGLKSGFLFSIRSAKMLGTALSSVFKGALALGASVIAAPFRILGGLINDASSGGGGTELRQNLENIRKEFGSLRDTAGGAIVSIARGMRGQLATTGLSVWRTFGNLAERLATIQEYAHNMSAAFEVVGQQFMQAGEAISAYIKGLGLTEVGQRGLAEAAYASGREMVDITREIASSSVQMGDQFGISSKLISRDVGDMMADFKVFGNLAPQTLVNISVFARKLGVDLKGLLGVVDRFDNFEDAARGAAQLTQAFGLQLDALELMKAQDPAERIEMLRRSFFTAGRSIENMTRQERALLAQQTGLEDSSLRLVFAQKNQALSYADVQRKGGLAQKSQMTQAEALKAVADQIERLVKSGSSGAGGFMERFLQGFERGIKRSREYRQLMINLRRALRATYRAGMQVGRAFVQMFPGVKQFFGSLANLFKPARFKTLLDGVKNSFFSFFRDMQGGGGRLSFKGLITNLKRSFLNYFNAGSTDGKNIMNGIKMFFRAMSNVFAGGLQMAMEGLTKGIRFIVGLLNGTQSLSSLTQGANGATSFVGELLTPVLESLRDAGPDLMNAAWDLIQIGFEKLKAKVMSNIPLLAGYFLGPAILSAIFKSALGSITGGVVGAAGSAISSVFRQRSAMAENVGRASSVAPNVPNPPVGGGPEGRVGNLIQTTRGWGLQDAVALGAKLAAMAVALSIGMIPMALSLRAVITILKPVSNRELLRAFAVAGLTVVGMVGLSASARLLEGINFASMMKNLAVGLIALTLTIGAMALVMKGITMLHFTERDSKRVEVALLSMSKVFAAAGIITVIAGGIGAVLVSSGGLGIAAVAAGLTTLSVVIATMAVSAKAIMTEINRMRVGPGFKEKLDSFVSVSNTIIDFAGVFSSIIGDLSPSIVDYLFGNPEQQIKNILKGVNKILTASVRGFTQIVNLLVSQSRILGSSQDIARGAQLMSSLLTSSVTLLRALMPPEGFNEGIINQLIGPSTLTAIGTYIARMRINLEQFMRTMVGLVSTLSSSISNESQREAVTVFGSFLSGLAPILNIFKPDGDLIRAVQDMINLDANPLYEGTSNLENFLVAVDNTMNLMVERLMNSGIFEQVGTLINGIISSTASISPSQLETIRSLGPIISSVFEVISGFMSSLGSVSEVQNIQSARIISYFNSVRNTIPTIMGSIQTFLPEILRSFRELSSEFNAQDISKITSLSSTLGPILTAISTLPGIVGQFTASGGTEGAMATPDAIDLKLRTMSDLFGRLFPGGQGGMIGDIFNSLASIQLPPGFNQGKIDTIKSAFDLLSSASQIHFAENFQQLDANVANLGEGVAERIAINISTMVSELNTLTANLGNIRPININTELRKLVGEFSLGNSEQLTFQHRNFKIEVHMNVHMDAEEVEKVLLERPGSRIGTNSTADR